MNILAVFYGGRVILVGLDLGIDVAVKWVWNLHRLLFECFNSICGEIFAWHLEDLVNLSVSE